MENLNNKESQMHASLFMGILFVFVGVPIWWKTTEVYRADLPYSEIEELVRDSKLFLSIPIRLVSSSEELLPLCKDVFIRKSNNDNDLQFINIKYTFETEIYSQEVIKNFKSPSSKHQSNTITIVLEKKAVKTPKIFVQSNRVIFAQLPTSDIDNAATKILKLISDHIINVNSLNDAVSKAYGAKLDFSENREFHMRKTVQPDKGYDIVFSLLCPQPSKLQATWDITEGIEDFLKPMISKLGNFAEFHLGSQVLYYSGLSVKPKLTRNEQKHHYLTLQQLPHVVNAIESRLGAQISPNPSLNFVVYMTEDAYNPMYIQKDDGTYSTTNSFLVPRWGAILFKNAKVNKTSTVEPHLVALKNVEIMEVFLAQLRSLLGIEKIPELAGIELEVTDPGLSGLTDFEVDYLMRARAVEKIAASVHTIHSLAQLLEKIHNIVINDNIASLVYSAVHSIKQSKHALRASELEKALNSSNAAFKASEVAFFDPTLLELLYFPEDQKFAIYIPLFLPISLPILGSLFTALKWLKSKKEMKQKTE